MGAVPPGRGGPGHQLVIGPTPDCRAIAVSCTCLRTAERAPLGVRPRWGGGEAYRAWEAHLEAAAEAEPGLEAAL